MGTLSRVMEDVYRPIREVGYRSNKNFKLGGSANMDLSASSGTFIPPTGGFVGPLTLSTGQLIPPLEYVTSQSYAAAGFANGQYPIYTFPNDGFTWSVVYASLRFTTASSSGTVDVQYAASGTALSSGTTVLNGTMSTAGTANTAVNATMAASPPTISGGAALLLVSGGTVTGLVNLVVTVALQRLS